jgi:hypothetical protein
MSYYGRPMGDYKTYGYAGDPGFLSSLWKGVKKFAAPVIGGLIGGPIGAALGGALGGGGATPPIVQASPAQPWQMKLGPLGFKGSVPASFPGTGVMVPPTARFGPGVSPGLQNAGAAGAGMIPRGYHYAKDGSGRIVRNRRMNVANPRALRRSMRRVQGFEKLARRTITFTRRTRIKKSK